MDLKYNFVAILFAFLFYNQSKAASSDSQTCMDLCASCNGTATFKNNQCVCAVEDKYLTGLECINLMKREATALGVDFESSDQTDQRATRCTFGSKSQYTKNDIEKIAKYFMQDGPTVGSSIFQAPAYTQPDCVESPRIITQPPETVHINKKDSHHQSLSSTIHKCSLGSLQQSSQVQTSLPNLESQSTVMTNTSVNLVINPVSEQTVSSSNCKCEESPQIITQSIQTVPINNCNTKFNPKIEIPKHAKIKFESSKVSTPLQTVSSLKSELGSSQIITQPQYTLPNTKCIPKSSPKVEIPKFAHLKFEKSKVSTPAKTVSILKSECVGSSQITTQPKCKLTSLDCLPKSSLKVGNPKSTNIKFETSRVIGSQKIVAAQPSSVCNCRQFVPNVETINTQSQSQGVLNSYPLLMRILESNLSPPMLGIPQAIQMIGSTPAVNELFGASTTILKTLLGQRSDIPSGPSQASVNVGESSAQETSEKFSKNILVGNSSTVDNNLGNHSTQKSIENCDSHSSSSYSTPVINNLAVTSSRPISTASANASQKTNDKKFDSQQSLSYSTPIISNSDITSPNPKVSAAATLPSSYINPAQTAIAPIFLALTNPVISAPTPTYFSHSTINNPLTGNPSPYLSYVPMTTYPVSPPLPLSHFSNYNSFPTFNPSLNTGTFVPTEKYLGLVHSDDNKPTASNQAKKICKKSNKQEITKKSARHIRSLSKLLEESKETKIEVPKIEKNTTPTPLKNKSIEEKNKITSFFMKAMKLNDYEKVAEEPFFNIITTERITAEKPSSNKLKFLLKKSSIKELNLAKK